MTYLIEALNGEGPQRQREQAQAYEMLCRLVGGRPRLEHDDNGAPYLPEHPAVYVSISHCRAAVAVAVSEGVAVGIDVESRRRVSRSLVKRVCTEEERKAIKRAADPEMEFLRCWTRKEAVLKMRRTGIQGYGSMLKSSDATDCTVTGLECDLHDVVAALALACV